MRHRLVPGDVERDRRGSAHQAHADALPRRAGVPDHDADTFAGLCPGTLRRERVQRNREQMNGTEHVELEMPDQMVRPTFFGALEAKPSTVETKNLTRIHSILSGHPALSFLPPPYV